MAVVSRKSGLALALLLLISVGVQETFTDNVDKSDVEVDIDMDMYTEDDYFDDGVEEFEGRQDSAESVESFSKEGGGLSPGQLKVFVQFCTS